MTTLTRARLDRALGLTLTEEQWETVTAPLAPGVIVAGAGSGKTTSMAARVAWLVGTGAVRPEAVLGLTFTTKATAQLLAAMRRSVGQLVEAGLLERGEGSGPDRAPGDADDTNDTGEPEVLTYHAFAARILTEHGIRIGREPDATVLTDEARRQLAYRLVCRSTAPLHTLGRTPATLTADLLALDDELTELAISTEQLRTFDRALIQRLDGHEAEGRLQVIGHDMRQAAGTRAVLADLVDDWRAEKAARDVIDFADQIRLAGRIVSEFGEVVADLRERYRVVLLDEYQDTSIAQRLLLQGIFGEGHAVTAVGDPCQAIYGWRGASVDNIENFPLHFSSADAPARRYALSMNRRSGPAVLEVANRSSESLRSVHSGVRPLMAGDNDKGPGAVSCALFETHAQEVDWLVSQIATTHASGRVPWGDIAVLAATSRDLVTVDSALRARGIPSKLIGAAALLAQPAVADLRAMLEILHDPCANPAFVRLAAGPRWRIGARDLAALGERAERIAGGRGRTSHETLASALDEAVAGTDASETVSLTEALDDLGEPSDYSAEARSRFTAMAAEIAELRRHAGDPLPDFLLRVMRATGIEVEAAVRSATDGGQQAQALHAFVDLAAGFIDLDGRVGLGAFLSRLRDAERFEADLDYEVGAPADAVSLLTIHKAKGLEFPYVFVPFVAEQSFPGGSGRPRWTTSPSTVPWPLRPDASGELAGFPLPEVEPRRKDHDAYLEVLRSVDELENDRLAYVAFTRAERGLAVSGHWWGPSQKTRRGPSRFLRTVHEACLDGAGTVAHWAPEPADDATHPGREAGAAPVVWPAPLDSTYLERLRQAADDVRAAPPVAPMLPGLVDDDPVSRRIAEWDEQAAALLAEARARRSDDHVVSLPRSVSASQLMQALADPQEAALDIARPMPRRPSAAATRGTAFHAWVETRYGQQSLIDPDDLPGAADAEIASDADLARLKAAFERSPYAQREPVGVEVPFSLLLGGRVVNGRIDAVFRASEPGASDSSVGQVLFEVVDWKTGSATGVDPVQLALYRLAWAQGQGIPVEQVDAAFLLVAMGEVLRPDTDELVATLRRELGA